MNKNYNQTINLIFVEIENEIFKYHKIYQILSADQKTKWDNLQKELDAL